MSAKPRATIKTHTGETKMIRPRVTQKASELLESERWCTCCKRKLSNLVAWLEFDQNRGIYTDSGMVESSQGWFPFGMICAKKILEAA